MIKIDRNSSLSVPEQLAEQMRFRIASGVYKVNDVLPATRNLADQLGISFHTVRKAYQMLVEEGILQSQRGSGYRVLARTPLTSEERLERGAAIVQETLQRLVGLGLEESDIEYLVEEQLNVLDAASVERKLVLVAPYREMAEDCTAQIASVLQMNLEAATPGELHAHQDADFFVSTPRFLRQISEAYPRIDVTGILVHLSPEALDRIARLLDHEALGLVTYHADTIPYLMKDIREQTGFSGQIFGASLEAGTAHLNQFIDQTDLIVYTQQARRRIIPYTKKGKPHLPIAHIVSEPSLETLQHLVPTI
jgi:GntR family transcriptional regulator